MTSVRQTIELFEQLGLSWVPVPLGSKRPVERRWQEPRTRPIPDHPTNIGILLTETSGVVDIDLDAMVAVRAAEKLASSRDGIVRYGRRSKLISHILVREAEYRGPRRVVDPDARTLLLEVRTNRQQSLVPPSIHPSGEQLVWIDGPELLGKQSEPGTAETLVRHIAAAAVLAAAWERGTRHDATLALAGWLTRLGWEEAQVVEFCQAVAYAAGDDESRDRIVAAAATVARAETTQTTGLPTLKSLIGEGRVALVQRLLMNADDKKRAAQNETTVEHILQRLAVRDDLRVVVGTQANMLVWENSRWRRGVLGLARPVVVDVLDQLNAGPGWYNRTPVICSLLANGAVPELVLREDELDARPRVLGLPDGRVFDFAIGEARLAEKHEFITRATGVPYQPDASRTLLLDVLEAAVGKSAAQYLQLLAGATLLGEPAKMVVVVHGPPNTGKTLFLVDAFGAALGDYAAQLDPGKVLRAGSDRTELWLSRAVGKRCVILSEPDRDFRVNSGLLKAATGRGKITIRALYGQPVELTPTWVMWIDTNWRPSVDDVDEALWSRIRAVEFKHVIRPAKDDPRYDPRFLDRWRAEAPVACLSWAIEGAMTVLQSVWDPTFLERPVDDATEEWRAIESEGSCSEFIATVLEPDAQAFTPRRDVWNAYIEWGSVRPDKRVGRNTLYEAIEQAGFSIIKLHGERGYRARLRVERPNQGVGFGPWTVFG